MLQSWLLKSYLKLYNYYSQLWQFVFAWIKQLMLIYHIDGDKMKNITPHYYSGWSIHKYSQGKFYTKIFDKNGTKHAAFTGKLTDIHNISWDTTHPPNRKQIILEKNGEPVNIDLVVLDNYKNHMVSLDNPVRNLGEILGLLRIDCTNVVILEMMPFKKTTLDVWDIDIDQLYD